MKNQRSISIVAAIALAAGTAVAIAPTSNAAVKTLTIAYQGPLTGEEAQVGIDELNGVKYAVKLFNAKNKARYKVNLVELTTKEVVQNLPRSLQELLQIRRSLD